MGHRAFGCCQLNLALDPPIEEDVLELDFLEDKDVASNLLISEEDDENDIFVTPARTANPMAFTASPTDDENGTPAPPSSVLDMLDMRKHAADRLDSP